MSCEGLAKQFKVSTSSLMGWEAGRSLPHVSVYPDIISFLGYVPFPMENLTYGEQLIAARHLAGITRKELARMLRMGAETLQEIENIGSIPKAKVVHRIQPFIDKQFSKVA